MPRPTSSPIALALLTSSALLACGQDSATEPGLPVEPQATALTPGAADLAEATAGENPFFRWLPPLGGGPVGSGPTNATLRPAVEVCEWSGEGVWSGLDCAVRARFGWDVSEPEGAPHVGLVDNHFQADWDTDLFAVDSDMLYRLRVMIGARELGHLDVAFGKNAREAKDRTTAEILGIVHGRTLPVKFRVLEGALCWPDPACERALEDGELLETTLTPDGGNFLLPSGHAGVAFGPGAVDEAVSLVIFRTYPDGGPCLPSPVPQLDACYRYTTLPRIEEFASRAIIGLCHAGVPEAYEPYLQPGKYDSGNPDLGVVALERVPLPFSLSCDDLAGEGSPPGPEVTWGGATRSFSLVGLGVGVSVEKYRGDGQVGAPEQLLPIEPTVRAMSGTPGWNFMGGSQPEPAPVPGIELDFVFKNPDGTVSGTVARTTDGDGLASAPWRLRETEGTYTLEIWGENSFGAGVFLHEFTARAVMATITGRVRYSTTPLAGVSVVAIPLADRDPWIALASPPLASTSTDESGDFSFPPLPHDVYLVIANGPGPDYIGWIAQPAIPEAGPVTIQLPRRIQQLSPANGATLATQMPTLTWAPLPQATRYNVFLLLPGPALVLREKGLTTTSFTLPLPLPPLDLSYQWVVEAFDSDGNFVGTTFGVEGIECPVVGGLSIWSACAPTTTSQFTIDPISVTGTLFYSSTPLPSVTVELVEGGPTDPPLLSITTGPDGGFAFHSVADGDYWLRVYGQGADARLGLPSGSFVDFMSTPITVTGADLPQDLYLPRSMELLPPEGSAGGVLPNPGDLADLSWGPLAEAVAYTLRVYEAESGELVEEVTLAGTSYRLSGLTVGIAFKWEVDAWDAADRRIGVTEEPGLFWTHPPVH